MQAEDLAYAMRQAFEHSVFVAASPSGAAPCGPHRSRGDARAVTRREAEILRLVAEGHSNADVARMLWIAEQTVKFHLSNIYRKLNVSNRTEASRWAQLHGLLGEPAGADRLTPELERCLRRTLLEHRRGSARPADRARPARRTAVLLDPHPLWLDALERVLGRTGVVVVAKTSTPRGRVAAVEEHRPDLFVTEIAARRGRARRGRLAARACSSGRPRRRRSCSRGSSSPRSIDAALRAGAVAYVIKTAHPDDLASAVRQVFDHSVFLGAAGRAAVADASSARRESTG